MMLKILFRSIFLTLLFSAYSSTYANMAHNFELDSDKGRVALSDFKGKVSILYFGYTSCPDVCPTSLSRIGLAIKSLTEKQKKHIQPLFISLDPERDKKENLQAYLEYFLPNIIGLTGTKEEVAHIANHYNINFRKTEVENGLSYVIDHASIYFIIGADGSLYSHLLHDAAPNEIANSIQEAISETIQEAPIISNTFIRATPPGIKRTGAYMIMHNPSDKNIALISAKSDIAKKVEIHEHAMSDGMMNMRKVNEVVIPAGKKEVLKPGGYHLMFFDLKKPINVGDTIKVETTYSNGSIQTHQYLAKKHFEYQH